MFEDEIALYFYHILNPEIGLAIFWQIDEARRLKPSPVFSKLITNGLCLTQEIATDLNKLINKLGIETKLPLPLN